MKKVISILMLCMVMISSSMVFADKEVALPFEVKINQDEFELTLDENMSTGYTWSYEINDEDHVSFVDSRYEEADTALVGAGGKRVLRFEVKSDGVSTISLAYMRSWEENPAETIQVLVYKKDDKLIIEEDQVVSICEEEEYKGRPVQVEGIWVLPLRETLESLGYSVKWNNANQSVDISKGAQWTSIKIGQNNYFKNKMAGSPLSGAPLLVDGQTFVPVEFFTHILDLSFTSQEGQVTIRQGMASTLEGYVTEIEVDENGQSTLTISSVEGSEKIEDQTIVRFEKGNSFMNTKLEKGQGVRLVTSPMMTMSLPGQTTGYIAY